MKIIVTGATGFVGRNIAESFHKDGMRVIATGRSQKAGEELKSSGIDFKKADILDSKRLKEVFSSADVCVHCAGKPGDWGRYQDFYNVNVVGTRNVIDVCKFYEIKKIIFVSTPSVYFNGKDRFNITENEPVPDKQFYYGKTKLIAEKELMNLCPEGFRIIIFRPRAIYGPHDNTVVQRILQLSEKNNFPLINHGRALIDVTYIDNFVSAVKNCLAADDSAWNEIYNISNGEPFSIKEWFSLILSIFDRPFKPKNIPEPAAKAVAHIMEFISHLPFVSIKPAITRFSVGYMSKSLTMSIEKARVKLDYSPEISNQEGLRLYKQWYDSVKQV